MKNNQPLERESYDGNTDPVVSSWLVRRQRRSLMRYGPFKSAIISTFWVTIASFLFCICIYAIIQLDVSKVPVAIILPIAAPIVTGFPITFIINRLLDNSIRQEEILRQQQEELRALAAEAARQREVAESMSHAKSALLANMSHELRTPLNAIIGFSDLFRGETIDRLKPDQIRQYATDINLSGRHLLSLVNDLLELARIEKGSRDFHPEPVHVGEKIIEVSRIMRTQSMEAEVELILPESRDLVVAETDDQALRQILLNLISNAIKFTSKGGKVELSCVNEGDQVSISVSDTGIGIPADELERIFEPFSQVDNTLTRRKTGTGLGLALVRTMVEQQDGSIEVQSEQDVGTTFTIRLPASTSALKQAAE